MRVEAINKFIPMCTFSCTHKSTNESTVYTNNSKITY